MEPNTNDVEDTVQNLCAEANECDQAKLSDLRSRLKVFLHEHVSILISCSEDTYQALRKLKALRVRRRASR